MRRLFLLVVTAVVVIALIMAGSFILFINPRAGAGFETSSLHAPTIVYESSVVRVHHNSSLTAPNLNVEMSWTLTPVYSGYGGVMNLTLVNNDPTPIYVYGYGVVWRDSNIQTYRDTSVTIPSGHHTTLGLLFFDAPANVSSASYTIMLKVEVQNQINGNWKDLGTYAMSGYKQATLEPPLSYLNHSTTSNNAVYYSKINRLVDMGAASHIAADILANNSGVYSIQAVADAFDWVRDNITYADDPNDNWQSAGETLSLGSGDCEDQAILIASMVDQMGGNARINIISEHAFASVYVGPNADVVENVTKAISSHYHTQVPVYFLNDTTGYWMVIDTTGFPYAGGLATLSGPVMGNPGHTWSFESSTWLSTIDATGSTDSISILPF